jgi:hypothetical protein
VLPRLNSCLLHSCSLLHSFSDDPGDCWQCASLSFSQAAPPTAPYACPDLSPALQASALLLGSTARSPVCQLRGIVETNRRGRLPMNFSCPRRNGLKVMMANLLPYDFNAQVLFQEMGASSESSSILSGARVPLASQEPRRTERKQTRCQSCL